MHNLGEAVLTSTHNLCFGQKYQGFFLFEFFLVFLGEIFYMFEYACFLNEL